jgi:hypothetical protein
MVVPVAYLATEWHLPQALALSALGLDDETNASVQSPRQEPQLEIRSRICLDRQVRRHTVGSQRDKRSNPYVGEALLPEPSAKPCLALEQFADELGK